MRGGLVLAQEAGWHMPGIYRRIWLPLGIIAWIKLHVAADKLREERRGRRGRNDKGKCKTKKKKKKSPPARLTVHRGASIYICQLGGKAGNLEDNCEIIIEGDGCIGKWKLRCFPVPLIYLFWKRVSILSLWNPGVSVVIWGSSGH